MIYSDLSFFHKDAPVLIGISERSLGRHRYSLQVPLEERKDLRMQSHKRDI